MAKPYFILPQKFISCNDEYKKLQEVKVMALTDGNGNLVMPVSPMYGGGSGFGNTGLGGDGW